MRNYEIVDEANRIITLAYALEDQCGTDFEVTAREEVRKNPRHVQDELSDTIDNLIRHGRKDA